ncbi:MAG: pilin [Gammaproteobacteria bacterium]
MVIAIIAILVGAAIPAYVDYMMRTRVAEGINLASSVRTAISEARLVRGIFPNNNLQAGISDSISSDYVSSITVGAGGVITVTFNTVTTGLNAEQDTIILQPTYRAGSVSWSCTGGTVLTIYRPDNCR